MNKAINWLLKATKENRYDHTIHSIADTGTLFLASNSNLPECNIIVWPETARDIIPEGNLKVTLKIFVEQYLYSLIDNNSKVLVFPTGKEEWIDCITTDISTFINDLNTSLEVFGEAINIETLTIDELW